MKDFQKRIDEMVSKILKEEIEKKSEEMSEKLYGDQHKLDVAKPKGILNKKDFDKLRDMKETEDMEESETEEGNEFSGNRADAIKKGLKSFKVDGKTYPVTGDKETTNESKEEKWIQKTDMKKGALRKKLGVPEGEKIPKSKLNSLKKELMKKSEGDKTLSAPDAKLLKQVNLALTLGGLKENKEKLTLSEDELIDLIESIVVEQKAIKDTKNNIKTKTPIGLTSVEKANKKTKEVSDAQIKDTAKKISEYLKDGSKETFTMEPKHFPQGNGEMAEMKKKAYKASDAVKQYVDNFAYPGLENTHYDEIKPNDEWLTKNLEGSSETGNNTEWANAVDTGLGKKVNKKRKENLYGQEKKRSYNRVAQPIETAGEHEGEKSLDKMFAKLESSEDKKEKLISEEMNKMKHMINYNRKTQ